MRCAENRSFPTYRPWVPVNDFLHHSHALGPGFTAWGMLGYALLYLLVIKMDYPFDVADQVCASEVVNPCVSASLAGRDPGAPDERAREGRETCPCITTNSWGFRVQGKPPL